ncbi:MAG TPA: hypothetical protein VK338_05365, partial [Candidatus Nitrosocosmicus sp.]|nr:hypothetical protein [Candidatus Nitrosocosmicus sp.]
NIFYLSYGLFWLSFLYQLFGNSTVQHKTARILSFFSIYSYPLYFIHYLLIMIVFYQKIITFNVWGFTIIVLFGSILIQIILNKLLLNKPNKT